LPFIVGWTGLVVAWLIYRARPFRHWRRRVWTLGKFNIESAMALVAGISRQLPRRLESQVADSGLFSGGGVAGLGQD